MVAAIMSSPIAMGFQTPVTRSVLPAAPGLLSTAASRADVLEHSDSEHAALLAAAHECALDDSCSLDEASRYLARLLVDSRRDEAQDAAVVRELQDKFRDMPTVTFAASKLPIVRVRDPHVVVHSSVTGGLVADTLFRLLAAVALLSMAVVLLSSIESHPASLPLQIGDWMLS